MAFVRVKAPDGAEFSIDEAAVAGLGVRVLANKPALDVNGYPLPAKPYLDMNELGARTIPQLVQHAEDNGIDLGGATRKDDILAAIAADSKEK